MPSRERAQSPCNRIIIIWNQGVNLQRCEQRARPVPGKGLMIYCSRTVSRIRQTSRICSFSPIGCERHAHRGRRSTHTHELTYQKSALSLSLFPFSLISDQISNSDSPSLPIQAVLVTRIRVLLLLLVIPVIQSGGSCADVCYVHMM